MTTLPTAGYLSDPTRDNGTMKTALENVLSRLKETRGGSARLSVGIVSDAFTPANNSHWFVLDTEGLAATDNLATITPTNVPNGGHIILSSTNNGRVITIKHGTGNISLADSADFALDDINKNIEFWYDSSVSTWKEVGRNYRAMFPQKSGNVFLASPSNGSLGNLLYRAIVAADLNINNLLQKVPSWTSPSAITIATDSILPTAATAHIIKLTSESGVTDDLKFIDDANMSDGQGLRLMAASGHTITFRHNAAGGTGSQRQITLLDASDRVISGNQSVYVVKDGTTFREVGSNIIGVTSGTGVNLTLSGGKIIASTLFPLGPSGLAERRVLSAQAAGDVSGTPTTIGSWGVLNASGTADAFVAGEGSYIKFSTTSTSNSLAGIQTNNGEVRYDCKPTMVARIRTGANLLSTRIWIGFFNASPSSSDTPLNGVGFRYSTSAGDTKWQCYTSNNSTNTITDSGITVAGQTKYDFAIDMTDPTKVDFYINGTKVATHQTNLPASTVTLLGLLNVVTLTAAIKTVSLQKMLIESL